VSGISYAFPFRTSPPVTSDIRVTCLTRITFAGGGIMAGACKAILMRVHSTA